MPHPTTGLLDAGRILDLDQDLELESDGDEAYIAAVQAASNRKSSNGQTGKNSGGFQSMGLNANLLKAIARKGFSVPTPIQRATIPLILNRQDIVGMARTGSGKTAAFVIPMIEKLKVHSAKVGARALILSPSRELALQTMTVVKEFARGTDLRSILLIGGESLEEQFASMATNPDIIIAAPGRFLHLKVEMNLDLSSIHYVVFDEADRLFQFGFAPQLLEILHALPSSRQTLLFSATLPKSMVEFTQAGLNEPHLVRLDVESKISPDLESAFFSIIDDEKEAALLHILSDVIKMPVGLPEAAKAASQNEGKKRKRGSDTPPPKQKPTEHSTIVFAATKHRVDYLASLLRLIGYAVSHAYSTLDQTARKQQIEAFRTGMTNILVVTDVAARGIDIPILSNVINYDFPPEPKVFVHRVGRTARAGQRGWSYSLVTSTDAAYLLDLQLFLGKKLLVGREGGSKPSYTEDIVLGALKREKLGEKSEWVRKLVGESDDITALQSVAGKGEKRYMDIRNSASHESWERAKKIVYSERWTEIHPLFQISDMEQVRLDMIAQIRAKRPTQTVFEMGHKSKGSRGDEPEIIKIVRDMRVKIDARKQREKDNEAGTDWGRKSLPDTGDDKEDVDMDEASDEEVEITFSKTAQKGKGRTLSLKESDYYMSYTPRNINAAEERGYGINTGSSKSAPSSANFLAAARDHTMDLTNDETGKTFGIPGKAKGMRWDKKGKKFVSRANDEDGSKGAKMVRGESGMKIAASFQSGRFEKWKKANKVERMPRTGEAERPGTTAPRPGFKGSGGGGRKFKHNQTKAPKDADKYRDDFHVRKKRVAEAKENRVGRFSHGEGKREIKNAEDIKKERRLKDKRKARSGPGKKGKRRG